MEITPTGPPDVDEEVDAAHHRLYELTAEVEAAVARQDLRIARWKLDELFDATGDHFVLEERLMRESAYPGLAAHCDEHAEHLGELHKVRKELTQHGLSPLFRIWFGSRFAGWMRTHVRGADQQVGRHLRHWREAQAATAPPGPAGAPPADGPAGSAVAPGKAGTP